MQINKKTYEKAYNILKSELLLDELEIEKIINLLYQLAFIMVEQEWDLILEEISKKY